MFFFICLFSCKASVSCTVIEELVDKLFFSLPVLEYFVGGNEQGQFLDQTEERWADRFGSFIEDADIGRISKEAQPTVDRAVHYLNQSKKYLDDINEIDSLKRAKWYSKEKLGDSCFYRAGVCLIDGILAALKCHQSSGCANITISRTKLSAEEQKLAAYDYLITKKERSDVKDIDEFREMAVKDCLDNFQMALDELGLPYNKELRLRQSEKDSKPILEKDRCCDRYGVKSIYIVEKQPLNAKVKYKLTGHFRIIK